jgi:hypothetical protein
MLRADEMREVLLRVEDPLEACRELTDRANQAGGHDNITVIVAHFDGPRLHPPEPNEEVVYQKYALPELPAPEPTVRAMVVNPHAPQPATAPSEEAQRESRRLRVGHTMVGLTNPPIRLARPASRGRPPRPSRRRPPHRSSARRTSRCKSRSPACRLQWSG